VWFQLKIEHCPSEDIETLSEELEELGALSIMLTDKNDDPVLEPEPGTTPLWPEVTMQVLYAQASDAQHSKAHIALTRASLQCSLEILPDKDWERAWMNDFKPQHFGKRLWICPTWLTPPEPNAVNLRLDPGLAFGTGTHATTSLCLTWLEQANLQHKSVIDYGCGSGILALAALKLGAEHAQAIDIDDQALQATKSNAQVNHLDKHKLFIGKPEDLQKPVDLIIANILLAPLIQLKDTFWQFLLRDEHLVVSGLLSEQAPLLIAAYASAFTHIATEHLEGWALLIFRRKVHYNG
jgi:ribosomal protein L11 methyltransferase